MNNKKIETELQKEKVVFAAGPGKYVFLLLIVLLFLPSALFQPFGSMGPGNIDLISFWTGAQLFFQGFNPYDSAALGISQKILGLGGETVKITWNPPWFFLLLSPVLAFPFGKATALMFFVNVVCLFLTVKILLSRASNLSIWRVSVISLLFFPVIQTLNFGQSSLVLTLLVALVIWAVERKRDFLAGIFFSLLSVKPHLLLGFGVIVVLQLLSEKRYKFFIAAVITLFVAILLSWLINPISLSGWVKVITDGSSQKVTDWQTATFCSVVRSMLPGNAPSLVPLFALLSILSGVAAFFIKGRNKFFLALILSLVISPYGWVFDFSLFVVPLLLVFPIRLAQSQKFFLLFLFAELTTILLLSLFKTQQQMWFLPALLVLLALFFARNLGEYAYENSR